MPNRWNKGDVLKLTRDCELGKSGDTLHVLEASGPYMSVRVNDNKKPSYTGRDYSHAVKVGESLVNRSNSCVTDEDVGVLYGLLLAAQESMRKAADRLPAPIVGSSRDKARIAIAGALQAVEMARYHIIQIQDDADASGAQKWTDDATTMDEEH